jgi:deazaflavin-dependent oxidoreductase (nitroreductase family)
MASPIGNFIMKTLIQSPLHPLLGPSFAVITVHGRKSGRPYSTPINVAGQPDGSLLVVSMRNRTWWRNLGEGVTAKLHIGGKTRTVTAERIEDPEKVAAGLAQYFRQYPANAKYFNIPLEPDGRPDPARLQQAALERVLLRLWMVA